MARGMLWTSAVCLLGIAVASAKAESPEVKFQKLYGDEAAKAAKSPAGKEAIAFAAKLVDDAGNLKGDPALARLLLEKAYELGCKSAEGCATAIQAARIRMEQEADNKLPWQGKLLSACRTQYQKSNGPDKAQAADTLICELMNVSDALSETGNYTEAVKPLKECRQVATAVKSPRIDDITDKLKAVNGKIDLEKKFSSYVKRLVDNPQDAATAKAAVLLCVVQLDRPVDAVPYANATGDETFKKMVPLAAQDVAKISDESAVELATWYQALAKKADRSCKTALLKRTRKCYEKILEQHPDDAQGIKLRKELDALIKELAALSLGGYEPLLDLGKGVKLKLVRIPAGKFIIYAGNKDAEHLVTLTKPFYMGITQVTQQQYEQVMGKNPSYFKGAKNPVEQVSWDESVEFCKKLSTKTGQTIRLPTQAEWEYACRAGSREKYCFGNDPDKLGDYAWYKNNSDNKTHPVGQKKPNAWGLYDMHGNVEHWVSDWATAVLPKTNASVNDPTGPAKGTQHISSGGAYPWLAGYCGSQHGRISPEGNVDAAVGFRIVVEAEPAKKKP